MKKRHNARAALLDAVVAEEIEQSERHWQLSKYDNHEIIAELYLRGVQIKDIFGRYLEYEVASDGRQMDVEDAQVTFATGDDRSF